jgi:hypothetical protein
VGAVAGLLTAGIQAAGDFSLQMPGNAALFCVLAAIALHRSGRPEPPSRLSRLSRLLQAFGARPAPAV